MSAAITISPTNTLAGFTLGALVVTGSGLADSHAVTLTVGGVAVPVISGGTTDGSGNLAASTYGPVPPQGAGSITVTANDGTNSPTATLTVSLANPVRETQESTSHTAFGTP
jgi:hypothetical protein